MELAGEGEEIGGETDGRNGTNGTDGTDGVLRGAKGFQEAEGVLEVGFFDGAGF